MAHIMNNQHRNWDDCREFGFYAAGGGSKYSDAAKKLAVGDIVAVKLVGTKRNGYVGVGRVISAAVPYRDFRIHGKKLEEFDIEERGITHDSSDLEKCEYVAKIDWIDAYSSDHAKWRKGLKAYVYQTVAPLQDAETIEFINDEFGVNLPTNR
jgi:hypothetical protein